MRGPLGANQLRLVHFPTRCGAALAADLDRDIRGSTYIQYRGVCVLGDLRRDAIPYRRRRDPGSAGHDDLQASPDSLTWYGG